MKARTIDLIKKGHTFSSLYNSGLSNHLPMALYAIDNLGANESQIEQLYKKCTKQLEKCKPPQSLNVIKDLSDVISKPNFFSELVIFFMKELSNKSLNEVLNEYLGELFKGVSGGGLHPLIRLAYSLEIKDIEEIAHALSAWVVSYQELEGRGESKEKRNLEESLKHLKESIYPVKLRGDYLFKRMYNASKEEKFKEFTNSVCFTDVSLEEISKICIRLYLSSKENFSALHCVTSCHAMRVLSNQIKITEHHLKYYYESIGAMYINIGLPTISHSFDVKNLPSWDLITLKACESENDHLIKLVYTCKEEYSFYKNDLFHLAAAKKVGF